MALTNTETISHLRRLIDCGLHDPGASLRLPLAITFRAVGAPAVALVS